MAKWVTRRDIDGKIVSQPELCLEESQASRKQTRKTIDEWIGSLLGPHESVEGHQALRKIYARGEIAGFIEISADRPPDH
jgi:hypothetical protein